MIRNFVLDDIDTVMLIWLEGNLTAHSFISPVYWHSKYRNVRGCILKSNVYVYEHDGHVCAFVGVDDDGFIRGLFVLPEVRSLGLGHLMIDYLKKKYDRLSVNVYEKNHRAVKFYSCEGINISKTYIDKETGEAEYVMTWKKSKK